MTRGKTLLTLTAVALITASVATPAYAKKKRTRVTAETSAVLFYANRNATGDFQDSQRSNYRLGAALSVDHDSGKNHLSGEISSIRADYFDKAFRDRWSNRIELGYGRDLAPGTTLWGRGSYTTQMIGLEYDRFNQLQTRGSLSFETGPSRFRVGGGYNWRRYDDLLNTHGHGPILGADYRLNVGNGSRFTLDFGYDAINADVNTRNYRRFTVDPGFEWSIGPNTDLGFSVRWRRWTYPNRVFAGRERRDHSIQPEVSLTQGIGNDWYVNATAGWRRRWSTDPSGEERGPRLSIGITKRFRLFDK